MTPRKQRVASLHKSPDTVDFSNMGLRAGSVGQRGAGGGGGGSSSGGRRAAPF